MSKLKFPQLRGIPTTLILTLLTLAGCASASPQRQTATCSVLKDAILIDTFYHRMWLCEAGQQIAEYTVAIGDGGVPKRNKDDDKTPIGLYPLGDPRDSEKADCHLCWTPTKKFHKFIPVGYPTPEQRANGFDGSNIGIHGPWYGTNLLGKVGLGRLTTINDWTQGCIAVGSNDEIDYIADWVQQKKITKVFIQ